MVLTAAVGDVKAEKQALRSSMIERRGALSAWEVRAKSGVIAARLGELVVELEAGVIALYAAIRGEVDLGPLDGTLRIRGLAPIYPRVRPDGALDLCRPVSAGALIPTGALQIPEPPADAPLVEPETLDLVVVPGLAFDDDGGRLGWGKGFYDRLLARAPRAWRVGVCFDFQRVLRCPREAGDEPVHIVVTEERVVRVAMPTKEETP